MELAEKFKSLLDRTQGLLDGADKLLECNKISEQEYNEMLDKIELIIDKEVEILKECVR